MTGAQKTLRHAGAHAAEADQTYVHSLLQSYSRFHSDFVRLGLRNRWERSVGGAPLPIDHTTSRTRSPSRFIRSINRRAQMNSAARRLSPRKITSQPGPRCDDHDYANQKQSKSSDDAEGTADLFDGADDHEGRFRSPMRGRDSGSRARARFNPREAQPFPTALRISRTRGLDADRRCVVGIFSQLDFSALLAQRFFVLALRSAFELL